MAGTLLGVVHHPMLLTTAGATLWYCWLHLYSLSFHCSDSTVTSIGTKWYYMRCHLGASWLAHLQIIPLMTTELTECVDEAEGESSRTTSVQTNMIFFFQIWLVKKKLECVNILTNLKAYSLLQGQTGKQRHIMVLHSNRHRGDARW